MHERVLVHVYRMKDATRFAVSATPMAFHSARAAKAHVHYTYMRRHTRRLSRRPRLRTCIVPCQRIAASTSAVPYKCIDSPDALKARCSSTPSTSVLFDVFRKYTSVVLHRVSEPNPFQTVRGAVDVLHQARLPDSLASNKIFYSFRHAHYSIAQEYALRATHAHTTLRIAATSSCP